MPGQVINREYSEALMEDGSLDISTVFLLDRVQKGKPLTKEEVKILRVKKLVEGRYPNVIISRKVAGLTHQEAEYTDFSGFDDQWYRDLILKALKEHGKLRRSDFDKLLMPKLPAVLSESQKKSKVGNLLTSLRVESRIAIGDNKYWSLATPGM